MQRWIVFLCASLPIFSLCGCSLWRFVINCHKISMNFVNHAVFQLILKGRENQNFGWLYLPHYSLDFFDFHHINLILLDIWRSILNIYLKLTTTVKPPVFFCKNPSKNSCQVMDRRPMSPRTLVDLFSVFGVGQESLVILGGHSSGRRYWVGQINIHVQCF